MEKARAIRLRALSNPLRLRILGMVTARAVSATEVAQATDVAHAAASYHLRQLATAGLIRPVDEPGRDRGQGSGRPQQRYTMRPDAFRQLGPKSVRLLDRQLLSELDRRLGLAGTKRTTTDAEVWLTARDWRRLRTLTAEASNIVHSSALQPGTPRSKHVSLTSVLLEYLK